MRMALMIFCFFWSFRERMASMMMKMMMPSMPSVPKVILMKKMMIIMFRWAATRRRQGCRKKNRGRCRGRGRRTWRGDH